MPIPKRNHQSFERPKIALALANGVPLSVRIARGRPKSLKATLEHGKCGLCASAGQGIAADQVASGEVGDGQRVAVALVREHELALEVCSPSRGTPR